MSELVSSAIRHGVSGPDSLARDGIELILWRRTGEIICAVTDPGAGAPAMATPNPLAEDGRGLRVVEALSATWGARLDGRKKAVWAALPAPDAEPGKARTGCDHTGWECRSRSA